MGHYLEGFQLSVLYNFLKRQEHFRIMNFCQFSPYFCPMYVCVCWVVEKS